MLEISRGLGNHSSQEVEIILQLCSSVANNFEDYLIFLYLKAVKSGMIEYCSIDQNNTHSVLYVDKF